ncbi:MAG: Lrp/AsnC family transcriptional regulator [Glaciihabitans sp.]|nr:Lrp/AsnC family transcriptional regulator [Glaciihabitans sp.]
MDTIDRAIIHQLRLNCRQSNLELADAVGLSPSPCLRRVKRLEDEGIITGYHASFLPSAVDQGFEVLVEISLDSHYPATTTQFEVELVSYPEVIEARRMFGSPDFEVVVATKDLAAYELFMTSKLLALPGVGKLYSRFPMVLIKSASPSRSRRS